jgi:nucleoside-diphosphate kinase
MKQTLVLLKPDALERGLVGEIISRLEGKGLKIVAMKMIWVDGALAKHHYAVHEGKPFFQGLVEFITSRPIIAAIFEGEDAVAVVRSAMGETDPARSAPGTIRGDLAQDIGRNLIHGSDSEETAEKEIGLFFSKSEILSY